MPVKLSVQSSIWELEREGLRLLEEPLGLRDEAFESPRSFEPEVMDRPRRTRLDAARLGIMTVKWAEWDDDDRNEVSCAGVRKAGEC